MKMAGYKGYVLLAVSIFVLAFAFTLSGPGQALADTMKPLLVQIVNGPSAPVPVALQGTGNVAITNSAANPVPVAGTVSVGNLPSAPALRYGRVSLDTSTTYVTEDLPTGVVVTDLVVFGRAFYGDEGCFVALQGPMPEQGTWMLIRLPFTNTNPVAQVHLTTGLHSTSPKPLSVYLSSTSTERHCDALILWTGYEN